MMASAKTQENVELESFLVTKHSWKGKYKRILTIGTTGISTYNPDKFDLTNRWPYSDVISVSPNKTGNVNIDKKKYIAKRNDDNSSLVQLSLFLESP